MPIDPNIALSFKSPQLVDPLDTVNKIQGIRNAQQLNQSRAQEMQLNQEKLQQDQIATAKMRRDQQDGERVRQAFLQSGGDPKQTLQLAIQNGAGPEAITGLQKHFADLDEKTAKIDSDRLPVQIAKNSQLLELHDQALQLAQQNPSEYQRAWPEIAARAAQLDPEAAKHADPGQPWTPQQLLTSRALHMTQDFMLKQTVEKREQDEETRKAALAVPQLEEAEAKAKTAKGKADLQQGAIDAFKADPASGAKVIDGVLPPELDKTANSSYKAAFNAAMQTGGPDAAQKIVEAAAAHAGSISEKLNAGIRKANVQQSVDTAAATAPIEIAKSVQVELQKAKLAGGIGQIIDPTQRNEASRTLDVADKEAIDKIASANSLKNTVQMALSGNKVAPNLETIEELRSIVNRVNGQELKAVGSSGDAYDKVKGWLGSWTKGQPIPDNIQKDFLAVADAQQKVAVQKHKTSYGTVGARFGVKDLQPPDIAGIYSKATGTSGASTVKMKAPDGTIADVPADQVDHFKSKGAVLAQ